MIGVKFGFMHSYSFLNLILNSKEIGMPSIKRNILEIPGADGVTDLTYVFDNEAKYSNRTLKFEFTIDPSVGVANYMKTYSNVCVILHGTQRKIILDDDADYYYYGVVEVGGYKCEKGIATFEVTCDCEPFKTENVETVVSQYINGSAIVNLSNTRKRVVPTITTNTELLITFNNITHQLFEGTTILPELELKNESNGIKVTGVGNISFSYQKGRL